MTELTYSESLIKKEINVAKALFEKINNGFSLTTSYRKTEDEKLIRRALNAGVIEKRGKLIRVTTHIAGKGSFYFVLNLDETIEYFKTGELPMWISGTVLDVRMVNCYRLKYDSFESYKADRIKKLISLF